MDNKALWREVLDQVKISVTLPVFNTWFSQTHLVALRQEAGRFKGEIGCNSTFVKATIEARYFGLVQDAIVKSLGKPCDLTFTIQSEQRLVSEAKKEEVPLFATNEPEDREFSFLAFQNARIKPNFTFENFAVSSSNQMAWAASDAVSRSLGEAYNPLFIWGGVGVGKTHLMNAIGHTILAKDPSAKVYFCTGEDFTNDIVEGIRNKTTKSVRERYRKLKSLFVDDIQFIAGKDTVQEEFFHTFNAVTGAGGQVVLTSDRPPSEIPKLEERLKSRFEAGLIVDIAPPDFELRCAILQIKVKEVGIELPMDLVQLVAGNLESARKIEGFLKKLFSEVRFKNAEITPPLIQSIIGKGVETNGVKIKAKPADVITKVSEYYSVGKRALLGDSRARPIARPRQMLMYILRTELKLPLEEVGRLIGGRDHSTVIHAVGKITQLAMTDVQTREDLSGIKQGL